MNAEPWGQLLSVTESESPIILKKETVTFGRNSACDINFVTNHLISSNHCSITQDKDGKIWLTDTSTNGSVVNGNLVKGEKAQLRHNDMIQLVRRKNQPAQDVSYIFQDLKLLQQESDILDCTQEYNAEDVDTSTETESENSQEVPAKKAKQDFDVENEQEDVRKTETDAAKGSLSDKMGEPLHCGICQDIFYDCLSLQPCMHSFCSSCYSQWMEKSNECPICRLRVERISRNHLVNNLVEAYLAENPEKRRSAEELAEMDAKNKINQDMIEPRKSKTNVGLSQASQRSVFSIFAHPLIHINDDSDDSAEVISSEDDDDDDSDDELLDSPIFPIVNMLHSARPGNFAVHRNVCRWCPGVKPATTMRLAATCANAITTSTATTASSTTNPQSSAPETVIPDASSHPVHRPGISHIMCLCCMKPMPRLSDLPTLPDNGATRSQRCDHCSNFFCHLLWKCDKQGCRGCLNEFRDLDFDVSCMNTLISDNSYESQILKDYLATKGWSMKDMFQKCLEQLDNGDYHIMATATNGRGMNSKSIICYKCGLRWFKQLAYNFRRDIPNNELPAEVTSRPDCYWGLNCRTQTRPDQHHARRFNHICAQTKNSFTMNSSCPRP